VEPLERVEAVVEQVPVVQVARLLVLILLQVGQVRQQLTRQVAVVVRPLLAWLVLTLADWQ
jgi:hypothetical protein